MTPEAVTAAAVRLRPHVRETPLLESLLLNRRLGFRCLLKAESLQHTGSFKIRGALNRLLILSAEERERGAVAYSSGNHAQGLAAAGALLGVRVAVVMPADAPAVKMERTRAYGAEVVTYDRLRDDRVKLAKALADERGAIMVPPFEDPHVIAGQGTVGLELIAQAESLGVSPAAVVIPASGGGLAAGCGVAIHASQPRVALYTAEPVGFDDHARSFQAGSPQRNVSSATVSSICDGLLSDAPGQLTWPLTREHFSGGLTASDAEVMAAMRVAFEELRVVLEPSGAVALAAMLAKRVPVKGEVIVVGSGGNTTAGLFCTAMAEGHRE